MADSVLVSCRTPCRRPSAAETCLLELHPCHARPSQPGGKPSQTARLGTAAGADGVAMAVTAVAMVVEVAVAVVVAVAMAVTTVAMAVAVAMAMAEKSIDTAD